MPHHPVRRMVGHAFDRLLRPDVATGNARRAAAALTARAHEQVVWPAMTAPAPRRERVER